MELALKLPKGKPPFLGLVFPNPYTDSELNADLLKHTDKLFRIVLEPIQKQMNLRLICEDLVTVRFYSHLDYNQEKMKSWLYITKDAKRFNFAHLYMENDKHKVIHSMREHKLFVLKVEKIDVLSHQNY